MTRPHDDITVRRMRDDEFDVMRAVAVESFGGDETIGVLLDALCQSRGWQEELSFVAAIDGKIVGQVLYTCALLDAPRQLVEVLVLSPVGVRPDMQGRGIGSHLIRSSLERLESRPEPLVFLEGSPKYYPRFGFRPGGEQGFRRPSLRIPEAAFMARPMAGYESWMTGTLVYPDAFWRTDSVGLRSQ